MQKSGNDTYSIASITRPPKEQHIYALREVLCALEVHGVVGLEFPLHQRYCQLGAADPVFNCRSLHLSSRVAEKFLREKFHSGNGWFQLTLCSRNCTFTDKISYVIGSVLSHLKFYVSQKAFSRQFSNCYKIFFLTSLSVIENNI